MKQPIFYILLLSLLFGITSCSQDDNSNSSTTNVDNSDNPDTTDPVNNDNTNTQNTVPANCTGTSSDGEGDGYAIHQYRMILAGHQTWSPGDYTESLQTMTMPPINEASIVFKSDSRLKVRFKVNSQPFPTAGEEYCYGRATGQASDSYPYQKLRFRVHLRDVQCSNPNAQDPTVCDSGQSLGPRYKTQYINPIDVNFCSEPIDLGALRNSTVFGTVIEIDDVKADSTCQTNGQFCPAEKIVRAASCWDITLQIVTDYTQDFK